MEKREKVFPCFCYSWFKFNNLGTDSYSVNKYFWRGRLFGVLGTSVINKFQQLHFRLHYYAKLCSYIALLVLKANYYLKKKTGDQLFLLRNIIEVTLLTSQGFLIQQISFLIQW